MKRIKRAGMMLFAIMSAFLAFVPAFADHIRPDPVETVTDRLSEYLPVIVISVLGLALATGAVLLIVFAVRRKKKNTAKKPEEGSK